MKKIFTFFGALMSGSMHPCTCKSRIKTACVVIVTLLVTIVALFLFGGFIALCNEFEPVRGGFFIFVIFTVCTVMYGMVQTRIIDTRTASPVNSAGRKASVGIMFVLVFVFALMGANVISVREFCNFSGFLALITGFMGVMRVILAPEKKHKKEGL